MINKIKNLKISFLTRLNNIIIVQMVFIFAAVLLLLFYQKDVNIHHESFLDTKTRFIKLGHEVELILFENEALATNEKIDQLKSKFNSLLESDQVAQAYLYIRENDQSLKRIFHLNNYEIEGNNESEDNYLSLIDNDILNSEFHYDHNHLIQVTPDNNYTVYYFQFMINGNQPAILSTIIEHDYVLAERADLMYKLGILFLCAMLVSLLIIYLINVKFKEPLKKLLFGLQMTKDGEVHHLVQIDDNDSDVFELTESFNKMSESLFHKEVKLKEFNSELEQSYSQLNESQEYLNKLIDNSPNSIISTFPDGTIILFNEKATEEFGFQPEEAIGLNINDLFTHEIEEILESQQNSDNKDSVEILCLRKDKSYFPAYLIVTPIYDIEDKVLYYLYILRDISESKNFQDMMIRLDRYYTRGKMAGDIAHEINNYLTILSGNIELMPLLLKKNDPEKIGKKLDMMKSTVDRISNFTDGLMDKFDSELKFTKTDINQLIETVLTFLKPQNKFDKIDISTKLSTDLPLVDIDPGQIQQLIVNLVYNAADVLHEHEGDKKIQISSHVLNSSEGSTNEIEVRVCDSGPGVAEDRVEDLFSKRFTTKRKGHGIGLITCQRIANAHSGRMVYSKKIGACFAIQLPVVQVIEPEEVDADTVPAI